MSLLDVNQEVPGLTLHSAWVEHKGSLLIFQLFHLCCLLTETPLPYRKSQAAKDSSQRVISIGSHKIVGRWSANPLFVLFFSQADSGKVVSYQFSHIRTQSSVKQKFN